MSGPGATPAPVELNQGAIPAAGLLGLNWRASSKHVAALAAGYTSRSVSAFHAAAHLCIIGEVE